MSILGLLFGKPLSSDEDAEEKIGTAAGIPTFGLDALGSAAYGPEAALTILIPVGLAGLAWIFPLIVCIVALLGIVYISYLQTIEAYPGGGGAYTVARLNLGARVGVLAGAALMIDYLLNVAVGISTGVGALVSAFPNLQPFTLRICLGILVLLMYINLRGVREAGAVFMAPTYIFLACMLVALAIGVVKTFAAGGHPVPIVKPAPLRAAAEGLSTWLLIKTFASGCTAMTGVEAVSNGVQTFREPVAKTAQRTLTIIIAALMALLLGVGFLVHSYQVGATEPGRAGYQSVLSQLVAAIAGKGVFYFICIGSILTVLSLSANTSFADFPRLCRSMAQNGYLPYGFALRGRRLVYSYGIYALAALSAILLTVFDGVTDRLIPLFAIGAFLSFTLSQAGMVVHWRKNDHPRAKLRMVVNGFGAFATGVATIVIMVAKFREGAWITLLMIPALVLLMAMVRRHYHTVALEIASPGALELCETSKPIVVVPIERWNRVAKKALQFAFTMSEQVKVLHINSEEQDGNLADNWEQCFTRGAESGRAPVPELISLKSPYRFVVNPIYNFVIRLEKENPDRQIAVVLSELVERHWFQKVLHNQRARVLTSLLTRSGDQRIIVVNVPWYID